MAWAPTESSLTQHTERRTRTGGDSKLPIWLDLGWQPEPSRRTTPENRQRLMNVNRKAGNLPQSDGWIYFDRQVFDYPDGLQILSERRIRWGFTEGT